MLPGLNQRRLLNLMRAAVAQCQLDLRGLTVLTEAATGAYSVTPILAGMAGAREVFAVTRSSHYGTVESIASATMQLAAAADCVEHVRVISAITPEIVSRADIVTNSGHVRPIDACFVRSMKPSAVIPLMYEAWEFRPTDLDLGACRERGVRVAGTNERHPAVDVFSFLGVMAVKLLLDAGIPIYGSHLLVLCDNPFADHIERGLVSAGAAVEVTQDLTGAKSSSALDAILVARRPQSQPVIGPDEARLIQQRWPGALVAQYWGDVSRDALDACAVPYWPEQAPAAGHMAILPSGVGADPIVRLQAGGLKVGEVLLRSACTGDRTGWEFVSEL